MTAEVECCCPECGAEFAAKPEGGHRLLCGDSTVATDVERVLGGMMIACILTDPPYCSGGFQESGKASGSIGSGGAQHRRGGVLEDGIANDRLSTRGYVSLIKSAISLCSASLLYVFTDWRMWVNRVSCVYFSLFGSGFAGLGVSDRRLIYKFDFSGARFIFLWTGKYDYRSPSSWNGRCLLRKRSSAANNQAT